MRQEVEMQVLSINDKDYFLLDSLKEKNNYYYFSNVKDDSDILVMKEQNSDLLLLDNEFELDMALSLFYEKNKDKVEDSI